MSEIKNAGETWMAKCNQLTPVSFKGLIHCAMLQAAGENETVEETETRHVVSMLIAMQRQVESNIGLNHVSHSVVVCRFVLAYTL